MNKASFASMVIITNLLFIFLQIHKSSQFIKTSYQKQKIERKRNELQEEKELLTHKLYAAQNRTEIKRYTQTALRMKPVTFNQIKHLPE